MHWLSRIDISYNALQGPIPDSTTFRDAPMKALQGNKRLCGDIRGFPSCKVFNSRIDRVTNNFDDEHCIGKDGQGVVTKLRYHLEKLLRQEISFTTSSKNGLLDLEYEARAFDFGIAKFFKLDSSNRTELAGTYGYIALELTYTLKVAKKCGMHSSGLLALEVMKGKHPRHFIFSICSSSSNFVIAPHEILDPRFQPHHTMFGVNCYQS
ncbi:hypothetical protein CISIN_1g039937mg [Citrus sinensis]|uniref:non-specific serine/threonine protein kinase n=1 Tax=Citrus sinensis TaxID=2711 RepID=A0A067DSZ4_CITSI|nr:hypothetical protein CISIN_1g039937mg [Citrus sinensis]